MITFKLPTPEKILAPVKKLLNVPENPVPATPILPLKPAPAIKAPAPVTFTLPEPAPIVAPKASKVTLPTAAPIKAPEAGKIIFNPPAGPNDGAQLRKQDFKDVANLPSQVGGMLVGPAIDAVLSLKEAITGKRVSFNIPNIYKDDFRGGSNAFESKTSQQYYAEQLDAIYKTPNITPDELKKKTKQAFWNAALKTVGDMSILVPLAQDLSKFALVKSAPEKLIESNLVTATRQEIRDFASGADQYKGAKSPLPVEIQEAFKAAPTEEKVRMLKGSGIDVATAKPSFVGRLVGVTDEEATQILEQMAGKPVRTASDGALPGYRAEPGQAPAMGLSTQRVERVGGEEPFKGFTDLSSTVLDKLEGRTTVSKQFISDLTNSPELKQAERETIRNILKDEPDTVDVPAFANKVKSELLPLKVKGSDTYKVTGSASHEPTALLEEGNFTPKYENVGLPSELRGKVANYKENIYESPISTSAGDVHYNYESKNYFAHSRIEDLPDNQTRRAIEIQSDLFQKGRLEQEAPLSQENYKQLLNEAEKLRDNAKSAVMRAEYEKDVENYTQKLKDRAIEASKRETELSKLEPYRNTWHERVIREEVKQAAIDGKTKLQFPTGETAMKIEGLGQGDSSRWVYDNGSGGFGSYSKLTSDKLKVGMEIADDNIGAGTTGSDWIITDVLGDGKFKAIPKDSMVTLERKQEVHSPEEYDAEINGMAYKSRRVETFDISGKVDTNNPIYKFYEKEVGRYLKNKYNAQLVTDAQGVKWWEINVPKSAAEAPIQAFDKSRKFTPNLSTEEATKIIRSLFSEKELELVFDQDLIKKGYLGMFQSGGTGDFGQRLKPMIQLMESNGKVDDRVLYHEAFHAHFNTFLTESERRAAIFRVKNNFLTLSRELKAGYDSADARAEEWLADDFADYVKTKKSKGGFANLWESLLQKIRNLIRRAEKFTEIYDQVLKGDNKPGDAIEAQRAELASEADKRRINEKKGIVEGDPRETLKNAEKRLGMKPAIKAKPQPTFEFPKASKTLEQELINTYKKAGEVEVGGEKYAKADEVLSHIATDMELATPGSRNFIGYGSDARVEAIASTFPQWIPEELRSRELFDKVLGSLEVDKLHFPEGPRPKQRALYNALLDEVDHRLGVDTSAIRAKILKTYERSQEAKTPESSRRSTPRREANTGEQKRQVELPKAKKPIETPEIKAPEQVKRMTQDVAKLYRMLEREKNSLAEAEANPEAHIAAYGEDRRVKYGKRIKAIEKRIHEVRSMPAVRYSAEGIKLAPTGRVREIRQAKLKEQVQSRQVALQEENTRFLTYREKVNRARTIAEKKEGYAKQLWHTLFPLKGVGEIDPETRAITEDWIKEKFVSKNAADQVATELAKEGPQNLEEMIAYESGKPIKYIKEAFDELGSRAQAEGFDFNFKENYLPHVYDGTREEAMKAIAKYLEEEKGMTSEEIQAYTNGKPLSDVKAMRLKLTPNFVKERIFPTYSAAIKYGLAPKYHSPAKLIAHYQNQLDNAIANRKYIDRLKSDAKLLQPEDAPDSYVPVAKTFSRELLYADPKLARLINGQFRNEDNLDFYARSVKILGGVSRLIQEIKLSAGIPFTNINYFSIGQAVRILTSSVGEAAKFDFRNALSSLKSSFAFIRANSNAASAKYFYDNRAYLARMAAEGIDISGRIGNFKYEGLKEGFMKILGQLKDEVKTKGSYKLGLKEILTSQKNLPASVGKMIGFTFNKAFNEKTFNSMMSQVAVQTFKDSYDLAAKNGLNDEAAGKFAAEVTRNFSGMTEQTGRGRTAEDTISGLFMAPKFREGVINIMANTLQSVRPKNFGNEAFAKNRGFLLGAIITFALYQYLNQKINGQYTWENPPGREFALRIPLPNEQVGYIEFLPSTLAFARNLAEGSIALGSGNFKLATQKFGSSFSMPISITSEVVSNSDYFGREIYKDSDDPSVKIKKIAAYVGLGTTHPFITETYKYVSGEEPLYQALSYMSELPFKYSNLSKEQKSEYYDMLDKQTLARAKAKDKVRPVYEKNQELLKQGNKTEADSVYWGLSREDRALYDQIKKDEKTKATNARKPVMKALYDDLQALKANGHIDEATEKYWALTADDRRVYDLVKKAEEKKKTDDGISTSAPAALIPEIPTGKQQSQDSLISKVLVYAKAMGTDPVTAFDRIFSGETIKRVDNGTVIVDRMALADSEAERSKQFSATSTNFTKSELRLDHTIPLELGGSNKKDNLRLITKSEWESYTPIENLLGKALEQKKINKSTAQSLITKFKNGELSAEEVKKAITP